MLNMANPRKIGTIRQLSLQCETPTLQQRRKSLKKQYSEDIPDNKNWPKVEPNQRVSSAKSRPKTSDRPPPVKIAWSENIQKTIEEQLIKRDEGLVAKKCKEIRRPTTAKITRQSSLDKDSIMYSRQELAERLRQAWNDREKGKQNLDIFLAPNSREKVEEELNYEIAETDSLIINEPQNEVVSPRSPKIIVPLQPECLVNETNYRNIFQKQIRKAKSVCSDFAYSPTRTTDTPTRSSTIVVVPVTDNDKNKNLNSLSQMKPSQNLVRNETSNILTKRVRPPTASVTEKKEAHVEVNEAKPINNIIIRPSTASSRREGFKKRVNSAFHETVRKDNSFRPPLVRSTSVPTKPEQKPKFLASKRRVKTAKRKDKSEKSSEHGSDDENEDKGKNKKILQRSVTLSNGEVETMVSLVSPDESDTEEVDENAKPKSRSSSPSKGNAIKKGEVQADQHKNFSLRKTVKSVSFQQSSIHAVRSFSASFPARRGSIATALMLGNNGSNSAPNNASKLQEKRAPSLCIPDEDEHRVPKRRLVRTKSAPLKLSIDDDENDTDPLDSPKIKDIKKDDQISVSVQPKVVAENTCITESSSGEINSNNGTSESDLNEAKENENTEPKFESAKEKQCWDLFCKMSGKGVNVSFDTILRGMLTPTEYRMRKKPSLENDTVPDNC